MKQLFHFPLFYLCLGALLVTQNAWCQRPPATPVTEMRGAWIATSFNIDWPSQPGLSVDRQKMEFDSLLDVLKAMNMNAVLYRFALQAMPCTNRPTYPGVNS